MILFRKIANLSLAVLLLVATTGITLNKHYCMGRLKAVAIFEETKACGENESEEPMPCCKDVSEHMKVEEITEASFDFKSAPDLFQIAIISFITSDKHLVIAASKTLAYSEYPLPLPDQELFILNQNFLI